jgi:RimJ/RimL family protein N-acetyltransferase
MPPFETERLLLRAFTMDDLEDVYREVWSDIEVCRFYAGRTRTRAETAEWLAYRIAEWQYSPFGRLAVLLRETDEFLGFVGLEPYVNRWNRFPEDPYPRFNDVEVELSFAFGRRHWGKGYAFEASREMIRYAFEELRLPRLVGGAHRDNEPSRKLQERLGYRVELHPYDDPPHYVTILHNDRVPSPSDERRNPPLPHCTRATPFSI